MIVADTGAILALIDKADRHHEPLLTLYDEQPASWVLPWAILAEVDYLVGGHLGAKAQEAWLDDLGVGRLPDRMGVGRGSDTCRGDHSTPPCPRHRPRGCGRHGHCRAAPCRINRHTRP